LAGTLRGRILLQRPSKPVEQNHMLCYLIPACTLRKHNPWWQ